MARLLADTPLTGCNLNRQFEYFLAQIIHRLAFQILPRVHIHIVRQQLEAASCRNDFYRWDIWEVRDRTISCCKEDDITACCHLSGDAFKVIPRTVHEIVAAILHNLPVLGCEINPCDRVFFHGCANGFEIDVVQAAIHVAARRITFRTCTVPRCALLKTVN
ncbi:hypothetical protein D3C85_1119940 [compost metagenome]